MKKYFITIMLAVFALLANAQQHGTRDGIYHFDWNQYAYPNNMHVTLTITLDNVLQENENLEIGFFYNNECRGREILSGEYYGYTGYYTAAVTINGSDGMGIGDFRLYNHSTNQELNVTCSHAAITFTADQDLGDYFNPEEFVFTTVPDPITITTVANPTDGGVTTGSGTYEAGNSCTITATANEGYEFVNWKQGANVITTNAAYTFTVTESATYTANFSLLSFDITVTADPTEGGTVSGGGSFEYNTETYLSATANDGYIFQNWTLDSEVISNVATFPITVTEDAEYVAHFIPESYVITATADPTVGGTVTGGGEYDYGTQCTLTATPETGYHFVNWTLSGTEVSTDAEYTFSVSGAGDYVAHFAINNYTITATANPTEGGTVSGAGTYDHFSTCTLTATPATGYHFINWTLSGTEVSTDAEYTFTVSNEGDYVANFELNNYTISATVNPTEAGTITGAGNYDHFSTCTLTVTPNYGYTFVNWTLNGNAVGTEITISFTVTGEAAYVANFTPTSYTINATADPTEGGTVSGAGSHNYNTTCTLTATANTGYTFVNWTCGSTVVSTDPTYSFTVTGDTTYVAHFSLNNYAITVTANPAAGGTVTGAGNYDHGATVTLNASANDGYAFINWTLNNEEVSTNASYSFTATADAAYVANFGQDTCVIAAVADPIEGGIIEGAGTYDLGATVTLTAIPNAGYEFVNWTLDSTVVATTATYSFNAMVDASYVAHFALIDYTITATADPAVGGTISGAGEYHLGDICTLIATPNVHYTFVNWTLNGEEVSTNANFSFPVSGNANYVAHFVQVYHVNAICTPEGSGNLFGMGTYVVNDLCTLSATARPGHVFMKWTTEDGTLVTSSHSFSFTVTEDVTYIAVFIVNEHEITVSASPAQGGTVDGGGIYSHGQTATITAMPNDGYVFVNWLKNGVVVSEEPEYSFHVLHNAAYTATFAPLSFQILASVDPTEGGSITGTGTYFFGETATLNVVLNDNYIFDNWTEDGQVVSTNQIYSFVVTGDRTLVAHAHYYDGISEHNITVSVYPSPVSDKLTIMTSIAGCTLEVYSITGAKVYSENDCSDKVELLVSDLPAGTYVIRLICNDSVQTTRFVKE